MRILLSTDTVGGVWDYTVTLSRELAEEGHAVLLAVLGRREEERLASLPVGVEAEWRDSVLEWMPGAEADARAAGEWLASLARRWGAQVAHLNQMAYSAHDYGAPTVVVVHSDVLSWFREVQGRGAGPEWASYARLVRDALAAADAVVAISAHQAALTLRHYGRAADRVIHNGIHPPAGEPLPRTAPLVLSAGRAWDEAKGVATLDRAVEILGPSAPPAHHLGDLVAPHGARFEPRALRCHGRVPRAEVDAWLARASLYAGTSLYEPFGLAPLEAALRGCALLLSDIPTFRELWDGCAVFHRSGDAGSLAEALAGLAPDLERCAALAAAARGRALERYGARRMAGEYLDLYRALAPAGERPIHVAN